MMIIRLGPSSVLGRCESGGLERLLRVTWREPGTARTSAQGSDPTPLLFLLPRDGLADWREPVKASCLALMFQGSAGSREVK